MRLSILQLPCCHSRTCGAIASRDSQRFTRARQRSSRYSWRKSIVSLLKKGVIVVNKQTTKSRSDSPVVVDKERARHVLRPLYRAFMERKMLFAHVTREADAPQRRFFPEGAPRGSVEHNRWLFFATMTDRRQVSDRVYENHVWLWKNAPELYSEKVLNMPLVKITDLLRVISVGVPTQSAKYWPRSARTLFHCFNGDPLEMYRRFGSVNDILLFKKEGGDLPGFGPKILSLLALFLEELGLMTMPRDAFPVDVHAQRFAVSTGVVRSSSYVVTNEQMERVLRPLFCEICTEERWKPLELSHAIWFLGNRCCNGCYANAAMELLCPAYAKCNGSISTLSYMRLGTWDMTAPRHRKGGVRMFSLPPLHRSPLFLFPLQSAD